MGGPPNQKEGCMKKVKSAISSAKLISSKYEWKHTSIEGKRAARKAFKHILDKLDDTPQK